MCTIESYCDHCLSDVQVLRWPTGTQREENIPWCKIILSTYDLQARLSTGPLTSAIVLKL